jgi:flagellar biosynthesis chaperone FliJ
MALRSHQKNVRDELSLEKLIEIKHEEARVEAVRAETRVLDEVGSRRSPA